MEGGVGRGLIYLPGRLGWRRMVEAFPVRALCSPLGGRVGAGEQCLFVCCRPRRGGKGTLCSPGPALLETAPLSRTKTCPMFTSL